MGCALQEKHPSPAYRLRGDINMLLLGDPGVAKSQVGEGQHSKGVSGAWQQGAALTAAAGDCCGWSHPGQTLQRCAIVAACPHSS